MGSFSLYVFELRFKMGLLEAFSLILIPPFYVRGGWLSVIHHDADRAFQARIGSKNRSGNSTRELISGKLGSIAFPLIKCG
jgi:hypothetical protein